MRYAKNCLCFSLRYGIIIIGVIDIIFCSITLGFESSKLYNKHAMNVSDGHVVPHPIKDMQDINGAALAGIISQLITIIITICLIVVAVIHKEKYRNAIWIWLGWTFGGVLMTLVAMIIRSVHHRASYIEIIITLLVCCYEIFCVWLVGSYYKLLALVGNDRAVGYDIFNNENEFSAVSQNDA